MPFRVAHRTFEVRTTGPGTYELTEAIALALRASAMFRGVVTVFCPHTSCSLVTMENASPEARRDLQAYLDRLVPPNPSFEHSLEGADDMPSHIKMALTRTSESIPFERGALMLGTWQGVYLWEHRTAAHRRSVVFTFMGE
jgi:secondary thiamine-phosphate synthase enzyme